MKNPCRFSKKLRSGWKNSSGFSEKTTLASDFQTEFLFFMARFSKKAWRSSKKTALASENVRLAANGMALSSSRSGRVSRLARAGSNFSTPCALCLRFFWFLGAAAFEIASALRMDLLQRWRILHWLQNSVRLCVGEQSRCFKIVHGYHQ